MLLIALGTWTAFLASPMSDSRFPTALSLLNQGQVERDPASLIRFVNKCTSNAARIEQIDFLIKQLGDRRFAVRCKASDEICAIGHPAEKALEIAQSDPDAERADRANRCLQAIREYDATPTMLAALFLLSYCDCHEAVEAIFTHLPFANDPSVIEAATETLVRIAMKNGRAIPEVASWVVDRAGVRRSIAGYMLGYSSDPRQQEIAQHLLDDPDPWVRLRTAEGMLYAGKEHAVPIVIEFLDPANPYRYRSAQCLLSTLFGTAFPEAPNSDNPKIWTQYRSTCKEWWRQNEAGLDVRKLPRAGRSIGFVIGIEYEPGRVWGCGPNGQRLWEFRANYTLDACWLRDGKVLVIAANPSRVYECDRSGKITWENPLQERPISCERLANGNTFIGFDSSAVEMRRDGSILHRYQFPIQGLTGNRRLSNGHFVGVTYTGDIAELDSKGELIRQLQAPKGGRYIDIGCNSRGEFVLLEQEGVTKMNGKGDILARMEAKQANHPLCGLDVLQDDSLLLTGKGKIVIIRWDGKVRWESKGGMHLCVQAHMR